MCFVVGKLVMGELMRVGSWKDGRAGERNKETKRKKKKERRK